MLEDRSVASADRDRDGRVNALSGGRHGLDRDRIAAAGRRWPVRPGLCRPRCGHAFSPPADAIPRPRGLPPPSLQDGDLEPACERRAGSILHDRLAACAKPRHGPDRAAARPPHAGPGCRTAVHRHVGPADDERHDRALRGFAPSGRVVAVRGLPGPLEPRLSVRRFQLPVHIGAHSLGARGLDPLASSDRPGSACRRSRRSRSRSSSFICSPSGSMRSACSATSSRGPAGPLATAASRPVPGWSPGASSSCRQRSSCSRVRPAAMPTRSSIRHDLLHHKLRGFHHLFLNYAVWFDRLTFASRRGCLCARRPDPPDRDSSPRPMDPGPAARGLPLDAGDLLRHWPCGLPAAGRLHFHPDCRLRARAQRPAPSEALGRGPARPLPRSHRAGWRSAGPGSTPSIEAFRRRSGPCPTAAPW